MTLRKILLAAGVLLVALVAWRLRPHSGVGAVIPDRLPTTPRPSPSWPAKETQIPKPPPAAAIAPAEEPAVDALAADLNAPSGNIARDLQVLNGLFTSWRLDFPRLGNPVGDNVDLTTALTGENPLRLPLIPRNHRAINSAGELADRWGTPFRFHALSGDRMEIRSAGPDKKFGTADDAVLTPP